MCYREIMRAYYGDKDNEDEVVEIHNSFVTYFVVRDVIFLVNENKYFIK